MPSRSSVVAGQRGQRPIFPRADWLYRKVPASPVLDSGSAAMVAALSAGGTQHIADLIDFGVTMCTATASTPRYTVSFANVPAWGSDPFGGRTMSIPNGTQSLLATGSDVHVVTADPATNIVYGLWQASYTSPNWSASWGGFCDYNGDGRDAGNAGSSTGSALSRWAAVIRVSEIQAGVIPHALFFSTDIAQLTNFRYPAAKTDGANFASGSTTIQEGTRVQLDPSINLAAISGITQAEITIGTALQQYGAYCGDNGGSRMAFLFEIAPDAFTAAPGAVYTAAGLQWDYYDMAKIPWTSLRVLNSWDGT